MTQLNEELARVTQERDQAVNEGLLLRQQLSQADATIEDHEAKGGAEPSGDLEQLTRERDDAVAERNELREQLDQMGGGSKEQDSPAQARELSLVTEERDAARREYAGLREQFETLKREQTAKPEGAENTSELKRQLEGFRLQLEKKNQELHALKGNLGGISLGGGTSGGADESEKYRQELSQLREQLTRAKEEASVAQRGLALSQKALHETRDTLREATEGTSLSRHNFDNLKNECATLVQQNTVLQAQNDQLARELAAAKSKLTTRL
jgi:chromosome segregation ATPase